MENMTLEAPKKSNKLTLVLIVLILVVAAGLAYLFMQYTSLTQDQTEVNKQKIEAVVTKVGKLIDLPADELPTLATVTDIEQLQDQPFFANAQEGDQVLLYTNAQKAYLYSPSRNLIVEVASLSIGQ